MLGWLLSNDRRVATTTRGRGAIGTRGSGGSPRLRRGAPIPDSPARASCCRATPTTSCRCHPMHRGVNGKRGRSRSGGFTLIELLVVVAIVLAVSALSVAMVVPSLEQRQIRNASLSVTSFLNGVRAEAIRTGRPTGVWIERADGPLGDRYATRMYRCTIPPAYSGMTLTAKVYAEVAAAPTGGDALREINRVWVDGFSNWLPPDEDNNKDPQSAVGPGDLIKLGYQGHSYRLQFDHDAGSDGEWYIGEFIIPDGYTERIWVMNDTQATQPFVTPTTGIPYQVFRQPRLSTFARSAAPPLVLPPGTVIDLNFSGDETHGPFHMKDLSHDDPYIGDPMFPRAEGGGEITLPNGDHQPIILMFGKTGAVERIYHTEDEGILSEGERPTGPIYLLLGRQDKAQSDFTEDRLEEVALDGITDTAELRRRRAEQVERFNLFDLNNLWITIHPRTGAVTSSEMAAPTEMIDDLTVTDPFPLESRVIEARAFARSSQGLGGG